MANGYLATVIPTVIGWGVISSGIAAHGAMAPGAMAVIGVVTAAITVPFAERPPVLSASPALPGEALPRSTKLSHCFKEQSCPRPQRAQHFS